MNDRGGIRWVLIGLLVVMGVLPGAASAGPIRDLPGEESGPWTEPGDSLSITGDVVREVRQTGPGVAPSLLGIDDGFLSNGSLVHSELRAQESIPVPVAAVNARFDSGGPDLLRETIDGALRATRDAFFDGTDTASFSLAGFDLNVTLRGERRGISVNGVDLLGGNQQVNQLNEWSGASALVPQTTNVASEMIVRQVSAEDGQITLASIRKLFLNPTTIIAAIVVVGLWVMIVVADVSRSRRG